MLTEELPWVKTVFKTVNTIRTIESLPTENLYGSWKGKQLIKVHLKLSKVRGTQKGQIQAWGVWEDVPESFIKAET